VIKIFEIICTGLNKNYGKKGEKRALNDNLVTIALKHGWIRDKVKYIGSIKTNKIVGKKEDLIPYRKIDVLETLELQNGALNLIVDKIESLIEVNKELIKMVEKK